MFYPATDSQAQNNLNLLLNLLKPIDLQQLGGTYVTLNMFIVQACLGTTDPRGGNTQTDTNAALNHGFSTEAKREGYK